jgi:hypothetical protein
MKRCKILKTAAAVKPAAGRVRTQAVTILPATPHRTAENLRVDPTPMIADVVMCVVETGAAYT